MKMSNYIEGIDIEENCIYYFSNGIIDIGPVTVKDSKYVKLYSVNPFYLIFRNINEYFEKVNKNKYSTLVSTGERKEKKELWIKIRYLISLLTKN